MHTCLVRRSVWCLSVAMAAGALALESTAAARQSPAPAAARTPAGPADRASGATGRAAQEPAQPGRGRGRGGRGGAVGGPPPEPDDTTGFTRIFDGQSLAGWDGDTKQWRVENGAIVGESTPENPVTRNSFLIWRGGTLRDFELKIEFRINGTNSGIQYRSREVPEVGPWVLRGYQADLDFANQYTGNIHDERGRSFLSPRGNVVRGVDGGTKKQVGTIDSGEALRSHINVNGWNQYHIIAHGPVLVQLINGRLMSVFIDDDTVNRVEEGVLGLQVHTGEPFRVEYRNIWLKTPAAAGPR